MPTRKACSRIRATMRLSALFKPSALRPKILTEERRNFSIQALIILSLFGLAVAAMDVLDGKYNFALFDAAVSALALFAFYRGYRLRNSTLPQKLCTALLVAMYFIGVFAMLPFQQEKAVWISLYPFVFFYLTGLRAGLRLSMIGALCIPLGYAAFPLFCTMQRISPYSLSQALGAFLFSTFLAYKYEEIRTRQEIMLRRSAESDPLTGLLNRRGFYDSSRTTLQHALRSRQEFAIVLIDIDDFKHVNDTQGHEAGDRVLKEIAELLQRNTRNTDLVARWGGEEFLLLLAHSNLEGARTVTENIRAAIAAHSFITGKHTASFGLATHAWNEPLETTIRRADQAMYQAKLKGKNRIELFIPQPA